MPSRIQLKRSAGWRKPPDAIVVARPTVWGNPFRIRRPADTDGYLVTSPAGVATGLFPTKAAAAQFAVDLYRQNVHLTETQLAHLHGHNLACWCPPEQACHADVLLEWANPQTQADLRRLDDQPCPVCGGDRLRANHTGSGRCHAPKAAR